ncbi:glycosyltransferase family 4 protein [Alteromonas pelagimontana]|uniref:Glycosyltransferase family 4 protein n=1 Tax=Alteromonas pelagimontana TaxID=1858656 RepID=A0A6M4MC41_9ALTE|nr:glycosyltransferase family 4 protein [Alteromonas pelagimontana]QJR80587.1 glycosyltransferase family 4 protein [Alteromonas pelagimontana]
MKILMTADTVGGVWTYAISLCRALNQLGVEVGLATMGAPMTEQQRRQSAQLSATTIFESNFRLCWMEDSEQDVNAAAQWLLELQEEYKPDLVHLNDLAHGDLNWHAPVLMVVHSCVYTWWQATLGRDPDEQRWKQYKSMVTASAQSVDTLVAPTYAMLNSFQNVYGSVRRSQIIYNGRDWPALPASDTKPILEEPQNIPSAPYIFAAGRLWDQAKNLALLASISADLSWPVYVAGQSEDPNGGSAEFENVHCLGMLAEDQLAPWLYQSQIYVAPAFYEPFGLAILEAARAGNALVLSDIPSLREVWEDAATYVNPHDAQSLNTALASLTDDPELRRLQAAKAQRRAARYSESAMAQGYYDTYHQMLTSRHSPSKTSFASAGVTL